MWKSTLVGCPDPMVCPENRLTNVYGFKRLYLHTYIHTCSNNERKGHEFEGGEKAWKGWFSGKKRNGKHNYIIISKITLNRAKEKCQIKPFFKK